MTPLKNKIDHEIDLIVQQSNWEPRADNLRAFARTLVADALEEMVGNKLKAKEFIGWEYEDVCEAADTSGDWKEIGEFNGYNNRIEEEIDTRDELLSSLQ